MKTRKLEELKKFKKIDSEVDEGKNLKFKIVELALSGLIECKRSASKNYIEIHSLIKDRKYRNAQRLLEKLLTKNLNESYEGRGALTQMLYDKQMSLEGEGIIRTLEETRYEIEFYLKLIE
ncbi:unnamed protein product [marine sediment metagenome]|uniref:Uncharacterized protein n=1 Tax=marine sediment metagenome TaxID=412755 RepID=X1LEL1_9ZZZZ